MHNKTTSAARRFEWTETDRAAALGQYGILDTERESDFDDLVKIAADVCNVPIALVSFVDTERQFFKAEIGLGIRETSASVSFCNHALTNDAIMVVPDASVDPRFASNLLVAGDRSVRFYAGAVIRTRDGLPIGSMCVLDFVPRVLDLQQIRVLELLATQAMTLLDLRKASMEKDALVRKLEQAETQRIELTREMSHRLKNTLAMVQAIAAQTFRQVNTVEEGRVAIAGRLTALAQASDILMQSARSNAPISVVVDTALAPHRSGEGKFRIEGPDIELNSDQGLGLALVLHELATNAAKYGAISTSQGHVDIRWAVAEDGAFVFEWSESGGPAVATPTRTGFGSRLMERVVSPYFDGTAKLAFDIDGVKFRLDGRVAIAGDHDVLP